MNGLPNVRDAALVGKAAGLGSARATDPRADVGEADLDASYLEPEVVGIDPPSLIGLIEAQQPGVAGREGVSPANQRRRRPETIGRSPPKISAELKKVNPGVSMPSVRRLLQ
jgi:hypothetical protein